jgi:hypothetical protein
MNNILARSSNDSLKIGPFHMPLFFFYFMIAVCPNITFDFLVLLLEILVLWNSRPGNRRPLQRLVCSVPQFSR